MSGDGTLTGTAGAAAGVTVPSANGAIHDGSPYKPLTFTPSGLDLKYAGGTTRFDLSVGAGHRAYRYFPTDPLPSWA
ncbi:hypothetical protein ACWDG1_47165 [Streptomyces sp. NPDC001177]